jgi:hypothetical protein
MKTDTAPLIAQPADPTPDSGPSHRPGLLGFLTALFLGLMLLGLGMGLFHAGRPPWAIACLSLFGLFLLRALFCLYRRVRLKGTAPRSHAVLTDHLGFRIDYTCHDVALSAFLEPDTLAPGENTRLLCFLENQASRSRIVYLQVGPAPMLGLKTAHQVALALSAGQATVYALPLVCAPENPHGNHDLPIALRITKPTGDGLLLPGVKARLHNLWTVHYATPYTIQGPASDAAQRPVAEPAYCSLASISEPTPRLEALEAILAR